MKFIEIKENIKYFFKIPFKKLNFDWQIYRISLFMIPFVYMFPFFGKYISQYMQVINNGECGIYSSFGVFCPGCGATRATMLIAQGHFIQSFLMHPFPMLALTLFTIFVIKNTLSIITNGKIKCMLFQPYIVIIPLITIIVNVIIRNILLFNNIDVFYNLTTYFHMQF